MLGESGPVGDYWGSREGCDTEGRIVINIVMQFYIVARSVRVLYTAVIFPGIVIVKVTTSKYTFSVRYLLMPLQGVIKQ